MTSPTADIYERAVKLFEISVNIWLHLFATCSSSGWRCSSLIAFHVLTQFSMGFILVGTLISIGRLPSYKLKTEFALYPLSSAVVLITVFCVRNHQRKLIDFFQNVLGQSRRSIFGRNCFLRSMRHFRHTCSIILPVMFVHYITVVIFPFVKSSIRQNFDRSDLSCIPYFLTCKHVVQSVPPRQFDDLCWDVESHFENFVKNVSLSIVFVLMILPFSVYLTFFAFAIIFVKTNVVIIREELNALAGPYLCRGGAAQPTTAVVIIRARPNPQNVSSFHKRLSHIIVYYCEIYRLMRDITPILNLLAQFFMEIFVILSVLVLAPILKEPEMITDLVHAVKSATTLLVFFAGFSVFCYGGQVLKEMNSMIAEAVYNLPWYSEPIDNQKLFLNFLLLLQRPCQMVVFSSIEVELRISLSTLYHMYSLLNIILSRIR